MSEIVVGQEQEELHSQPQSKNNVQTISRRTLFGTAFGPEPESFRNSIMETMKSFSLPKEELFTLRQINTSFYKNFCPIYLKKLHKTLHINSQVPSQLAEHVTKIPKEIAYIYREIVIEDLEFLSGGAEEERVINSLQTIMPHIGKLDIFAMARNQPQMSTFELIDKNYLKLIHFLKYFSFNGLFPRLEVLKIRHFDADYYFRSFGKLFSTIPERVRINLNFQGLEMFPEVISEIYKTQRSNIFLKAQDVSIHFTSELLFFNTFLLLQEWIQDGKLKIHCLTLYLFDMLESDPDFDWRALDGIIRQMKFTGLYIFGFQSYHPEPERYPYPDFLSMPGEWKQQIDSLDLINYSHPLLGLKEFPNLKYLHIAIVPGRDPNVAIEALFPNPCYIAAIEHLRNVFGGLCFVKLSMEISYKEWTKVRRILKISQLIECIKPLVREFELDIVPDNTEY